MNTTKASTVDPEDLLRFPECEAEMRAAAEEVAFAAGSRSDAPSYDERVNAALREMRHGDVRRGFDTLAQLAAAGEPFAPQLLAWLQRYRAIAALKVAAGLFDLAIERGYEPARLHRDRVAAMLDVPLPRVLPLSPPKEN